MTTVKNRVEKRLSFHTRLMRLGRMEGMKVIVRVTPKSRKEKFELSKRGEYSAAVKEAAERNEANNRVQELVAEHFNVPLTSVKFITGVRSRKKTFEVVEKR